MLFGVTYYLFRGCVEDLTSPEGNRGKGEEDDPS